MPIRLASNLELPDNCVTQKYAFIARSGAGKTHNAGKLVEGFLDLGAPTIILDPVGTWWGLRLSASGKRVGYTIPVFGGMHGDIDLDPDQGEQLGKLLVERSIPAVIDVSAFRKNQRKHFVTEFAVSLFEHSKQHRVARHLVIEEAQVFAPQRTAPGEEAMLGAIEDLCRLGRNFGIGTTLISQRPQSINKEVLNQAEVVCVGQLNAKHERDAVEAWVLEHKADKNWISKLPSLPIGTMVVWSPQWLGIMETVKFEKKKTFDASATPELGDVQLAPKKLEDIDVEELKIALAPVKPEAKTKRGAAPEDDVSADKVVVLLEGITSRVLEQELALDGVRASQAKLQDAIRSMLWSCINDLKAVRENMETAARQLEGHLEVITPKVEPKNFFLNEQHELPPTTRSKLNKEQRAAAVAQATKPKGKASEPHVVSEPLKGGAVRILKAMASFYPAGLTRPQIGKAAKVKHSTGTFGQYWAALNRCGFIDNLGGGLFATTKLGMGFLGSEIEKVPQDYEGRYAFWTPKLKAGERKMLDAILKAGHLTRTELGDRAGYASDSGTFGQYIATLTRYKLVRKDGMMFIPHPWLLGKE